MVNKYMLKTLAIPLVVSMVPTIGVHASDTWRTIQVTNCTGYSDLKDNASSYMKAVFYEEGTDLVNVYELAQDIGEKITETNDGVEVYLNGKKVDIAASTGCVYVDGTQVYDKATKINGKYTIPRKVIEKNLGILSCSDAVRIYVEKESDGTVKVSSITSLSGYSYDTSYSGDGDSSDSIDSANNGYTPVYDYDLRDYIDAYIFKHDLSKITYDANLANMLEQRMNAERQANINEGWHTKDGKFYFLKKGVPVTGWYKDCLMWYYFNSDGSMKTGWLNDNGNWYYFYDSGAMAQKVLVNGYYLNENGALTNDVPANAPTGIAYKELINRVRNLGFSDKTKVEADDPYNTSKVAEYEFEWYSKRAGQSICYLDIRDNYTFSLAAQYDPDDKDYNKDTYQILQWLLPTQLPEVYAKINANPVPQTIYADGRIVDVSFHQFGIDFKIRDQ